MGSPLQAIMSMFQAPMPRRVRTTPDGSLDIGSMLAGAQIQPSMKSPYERTMRPGETRSAGDVQDMLAEVILAAGSGALPAIGAKGMGTARSSRPRPNGDITLFHGTTRENAAKIEREGFKEGGSNPYSGTPRGALSGIYLAPSRSAASNYSPDGTIVEVRVKKSLLRPDNTDYQHKTAEESLYHPKGGLHGAARVDYGTPLEVVKVHRSKPQTKFWAVANSFTKVAPDGAKLGPFESVNEALREARATGWKEFGVE